MGTLGVEVVGRVDGKSEKKSVAGLLRDPLWKCLEESRGEGEFKDYVCETDDKEVMLGCNNGAWGKE